jgi:acyl-CoA thioesterase
MKYVSVNLVWLSVQLILLQKEEAGFEHQAAIMPDVPPPEQARIFLSFLWYMWMKKQISNKQSNAALFPLMYLLL